jgi:ribonuclease D
MNLAPLSAPLLVDTPSALKDMAELLSREPRLAVDTEANSLHAFQERVCLIQFSTPQADYLVDPLALVDLTYLAPLFSDQHIEIIFHAAEYDVLGLQRDFDFSFSHLFDTMLAARVLGYKQVGLASLLSDKFGLEVDKHNQKADWGARPLSPSMIDYARLDTHYLIALRDILENELHDKNRWELANEDFQRNCFVNTNNKDRPVRAAWERIDGRQDLTHRQQTILRELCLGRERLAARLDRPLFKVVDDRVLLKIATAEPRSLDQLASAGLSERQLQRFGKTLLESIERGLTAPLVHATEMERTPDAVLNRLQRLKAWRKKKAEEMGVESDVILPRVYMQALAEQNPRNPQTFEKVLTGSPWRIENFGPELMNVLGIKSTVA